jgi:ABC-2 type transport system permease protein
MGLLGVFAFGHEYRHGTIRAALTVLPRRAALAGAKMLVVAAWALAVALGGVLVSTGVLLTVGQNKFGDNVGLGSPGMARVATGAVLYVALTALAGLALGWLLRSLPAAIVLLVALPVMVEPALQLVLSADALHLDGWNRYLPFSAGARMYAYSTQVTAGPSAFRNDLSPLAGGLVFATAIALILGAALVLFQRRDS